MTSFDPGGAALGLLFGLAVLVIINVLVGKGDGP